MQQGRLQIVIDGFLNVCVATAMVGEMTGAFPAICVKNQSTCQQ
jgi:hypothetical protein